MERCDCNVACLKATGHLNEEKHQCQTRKKGLCQRDYIDIGHNDMCDCVGPRHCEEKL